MMLGLRDPFAYFECVRCGCVQLETVPADFSRYYPREYYSFDPVRADGPLKRFLRRAWARSILGSRSLLGDLLVRRRGVSQTLGWIRKAGATFDDAILDVGSGAGLILHSLSSAGFTNLTGIDPFLGGDSRPAPGFALRRGALEDLEGPFDFILLNHSVEHIPNPGAALRNVRRLLRADGVALLRLPLAGTHAWRTYGADWVQLDAPRHVFLPTERSVKILVEGAALRVEDVVHDSTAFQFWGSEQYRRGIPLRDARSHATNPRAGLFSARELEDFARRAAELNATGDGDQASFYLRRA
jgi:SAM-dependent methyltransferase